MAYAMTKFKTIYDKIGENITFNSTEDLKKILHSEIISGSIFVGGKRNNKSFLSTDILILDIDGGTTKEAVLEALKGFKALITFTKSHRKNKNGVIAERMRVVLFLDHAITERSVYTATWKAAQKLIPEIDAQCCDPARIYYPSVEDELDKPIAQEGKLFEVIEPSNPESPLDYVAPSFKDAKFENILDFVVGKYSDVKHFVDFCHTGLPRQFNRLLNKTAFLMATHGAVKEDFVRYFSPKCEHPFDATDLAVVESAFSSGEKVQKTPRDNISFYVRNYFASENLSTTLSGILRMNGISIKKESLINQIFEKAIKEGVKKNNKATIQSILANWEDEEKERLLVEARKKIAFDENISSNAIETFCMAITGEINPKTVAVIKHFIWQVKCKLFKKDVSWHMMPVLYGKSGSGKTQAIRRLLSPIHELTLETDFESASDTRCDHNFEAYYVFFVDELARTARADFAAIKRKMTSEVIEYRVLGLNANNRIQNNVTWIGTSNLPINDVIKDCTSIRRFYQIKTLDKCDWDTINSIDFHQMWKSVDESALASPIEHIIGEISTEQEKHRHHDFIESWAVETGIAPIVNDDWKLVASSKLMQSFKAWRDNYNVQGAFTAQYVGRRLTSILGQESMPVEGVRTYKVSKNFNPSPWGGSTESTDY